MTTTPSPLASLQAIPTTTTSTTQPHPAVQPPSHKDPKARKTYLHRLYVSLLRSSPVAIVFQHNNVLAREWTALRLELDKALRRAGVEDVGARVTVVHAGLLFSAVRAVEAGHAGHAGAPEVHAEGAKAKGGHALRNVLSGPIGLLTMARVDPRALRAALDLLFPVAGKFPRGVEPVAKAGMEKLSLLAGRVERGRVLDGEGVRWVGGLQGVEGLRGELVAMLRGVGGGEVVRSLERVGMGVVGTVEGRRRMLEEEEQGGKKEGEKVEG